MSFISNEYHISSQKLTWIIICYTNWICFLSESHILEDVNKCIIALRDQDVDNLDRAAGAIRGRAARVAHIVTGEMDSYEPGAYTEGVMRNVNFLTTTGKSQSPTTAPLFLILSSM